MSRGKKMLQLALDQTANNIESIFIEEDGYSAHCVIAPDNELLEAINSVLDNQDTKNEISIPNKVTIIENVQLKPPDLIALQPVSFSEQIYERQELQENGELSNSDNIIIIGQNEAAKNQYLETGIEKEDIEEENMQTDSVEPDYSKKEKTKSQEEETFEASQSSEEPTRGQRLKNSSLLQKNKRLQGLDYLGCNRKGNEIKKNIPKHKRNIKLRCLHTSKKGKSTRSFLCGCFTEDDRRIIFEKFWKLESWAEKKMFVKGSVTTRHIKRRRKNLLNPTKKQEGRDIYLQKTDGEKIKVCRAFFVNTLSIGEDTFKRWTKNNFNLELPASDELEAPRSCDEPKVNPRKLVSTSLESNIKKWLDSLPKVPSHYCRSSSKKIYLESIFRSSKHLYEVYQEWCKTESIFPVSGLTFFKKTLDKQNIAIHHPRKDQCDTCTQYKTKQLPEEDYLDHLRKKDEARIAKNVAKESAANRKIVLTMDLQSVLLCPKVLASKHYYKQKLQLHNFTLYVLNNKDVFLYVWHECNGGVTANEFVSCIRDFIDTKKNDFDHFVLISDGCSYQNRNKILASALSDLAVRDKLIIEQLYLEKGHTMMEADSVHATLEKYFIPPINSPGDYIAKMRAARPSQPYTVKVVDYSFFVNFEKQVSNLKSIRPGSIGGPVVTNIRALKYMPNGDIFYKLNHSDEFAILPQRKPLSTAEPDQLYREPLAIAESKYLHLQDLKDVIETDHHAFYDNLPYRKDKEKGEKRKQKMKETTSLKQKNKK